MFDRTVSLDAALGENDAVQADRISDNGLDPEAMAVERERQSAVFRELGKLPHTYREAVVLCDIEGYSYVEIAAMLGIGIGTVKSRIARGRGILKEKLRDF